MSKNSKQVEKTQCALVNADNFSNFLEIGEIC